MRLSFWINYLICKTFHSSVKYKGTRLLNFWVRGSQNNQIDLSGSSLRNTRINIVGIGNKVDFKGAKVSDTLIDISGEDNTLTLWESVNLRKSNIIVRGNHCKVEILQGTTFGSVRIVNVGSNNSIHIGRNCLFSDYIEIWASDTHAIYDENGDWVNPERPVTIGDNVWVGSHVKILKGVKVGNGAILGMGAMVTKNIPHKSIAAGSPAKVLKNKVSWTLEYPLPPCSN